MGRLQYIAAQENIKNTDIIYADRVRMTYMVQEETADRFIAKLTEATSAQAGIEKSEALRFALVDDQVLIV